MEDNHFPNILLSMLNFRLLFSENNDYGFQKSKSLQTDFFLKLENQSQKLLLEDAPGI